jgi:autotransporter-associated beta strand protein
MRQSKRTQVLIRAASGFGLVSFGLLAFASQARANLTIVPLFDTTITSDPNVATIEATINTAISNIESYIANPVTVNITFAEMSSGLGQSQTFNASASYSTYLSALQTNQVRSADDTAALATLSAGPGNPVNGNANITATLPLFRALGFSGADPPAGQPDSTISFNASIVNDSRPGTNASNFDLESTVAHEMDEVLGIGGAGSQLNAVLAGSNTLTGPVGPLDLFRYSAASTRSYTTSPSVSSYFSFNGGTTDFVNFNQDDNKSDYADWGDGVVPADGKPNNPAQVQDAFGEPGDTAAQEPNVGPNELAALDVVGSNLTAAGLALEAQVPVNLTWKDASGNNIWDPGISSNWNTGSATTVFHSPDNITFNDSNGSASGRYSVTLSALVAPGSTTVNNTTGNYTISGTGTIGGTGSLTKSGSGTLTLSTPNVYSGGTIVTAGKLVVAPAGSNATFFGNGTLDTSNTLTALPTGALTISGGIVQLADGVTNQTFITPGGSSPLVTSKINLTSLSLTGTGTLDIGNNRILIDYGSGPDPIASIKQWIANGFADHNAVGSGPAIISSDVATDDAASGFSYGIGYADAADGAVAGLPLGEIEIMFTLLGDANLDGTVNSEDFTPLSANLGQNGAWDQGDFNYDGTVNSEDFTPFSHNLSQTAVLAAQEGALETADGINSTNVPEPMSAGMMVMAGLGVMRRRRRRES